MGWKKRGGAAFEADAEDDCRYRLDGRLYRGCGIWDFVGGTGGFTDSGLRYALQKNYKVNITHTVLLYQKQ